MNNRFQERLRKLSIAIFLLGVVTASVAFVVNQSKRPKRPVGFTLITKETFSPSSKDVALPPVAYFKSVRFQKSDGTWKNVRTGYTSDGVVIMEDTAMGVPGRGVFQVDPIAGELTFLSAMEAWKDFPVYDWRKDPLFLKEDTVLGHKTYVVRRHDEENNSTYIDSYYAPDLNNYPIKEVHVSPMGTATEVAQKIVLGNPDDQQIGSLPDWPIKYELFEQKIQAMKESGKPELAEAMQKELQRRAQSKPAH
jgi:hypothetical protein